MKSNQSGDKTAFTQRVSVRVPHNLLAAALAYAERSGVTLSYLINEGLRRLLADVEGKEERD